MKNTDLTDARRILDGDGFTCVLCRDGAVHTSTARGVRPLLDWLEQGLDLRGFSAADKVVGKATAFLYCLLGVEAVFARVMSHSAAAILRENGVSAEAQTTVPYIINRSGDGQCPMEQAVEQITDPRDVPGILRERLAQLNAR